MEGRPQVQPLPYKARKRTFLVLLFIFLISLPFLFFYATGYRLDISEPTNLYSTGGLYIAVDRTGAEIYIDGELVRETRAFRKAFYAQNIAPGTHRVHVQSDGYHTWVKELPVTKRLVTEAEAFNLPIVPSVRVISPWQTATGTMVIDTLLPIASTTNDVMSSTTKPKIPYIQNTEYLSLIEHFIPTTSTSTSPRAATVQERVGEAFDIPTTTSTSSESISTTTKESNGVRLYESEGDVYARWIDTFESMPYYYCAPPFPPYSASSSSTTIPDIEDTELDSAVKGLTQKGSNEEPLPLMHPVQSIPPDTVCDPAIRLDRKGQVYSAFEFFPGSTDLVILSLEDGIYVVEIDDRGWQNMQPLMLGDALNFYIENGAIYVYDGALIYQIILQLT